MNQSTMPSSMYKNIIFDLGGVLIDWRPEDFLKMIFADQPQALEQFARGVGGNPKLVFEKISQSANRGTMTADDLARELSRTLSIDEIYSYRLIQDLPNHLIPIDRGLDLVNEVKRSGRKLYVLSNFIREWFDPIEQRYDFFKLFDGATISYRVGFIKPEPDIYQSLLLTHGLKAEESFFIDDLEANIEAGKACGINGIVCSDLDVVRAELVRLGVLEK